MGLMFGEKKLEHFVIARSFSVRRKKKVNSRKIPEKKSSISFEEIFLPDEPIHNIVDNETKEGGTQICHILFYFQLFQLSKRKKKKKKRPWIIDLFLLN